MTDQIVDRRQVFLPGPVGDTGPQGKQGLPGVNAVPADQAVAAYLSDAGTRSGALFAEKADKADVYSKHEMDAILPKQPSGILGISRTRDEPWKAILFWSWNGVDWQRIATLPFRVGDAPTLFLHDHVLYVISNESPSYWTDDMLEWHEFDFIGSLVEANGSGMYWVPKLFADGSDVYMCTGASYVKEPGTNRVGDTSYRFDPMYCKVTVNRDHTLSAGRLARLGIGDRATTSHIDPCIIKSGDLWYMAVKNETSTETEIYCGDSLTSWMRLPSFTSHVWGVEAPCLVQTGNNLSLFVSAYALLSDRADQVRWQMKDTQAVLTTSLPVADGAMSDGNPLAYRYHECNLPGVARHFHPISVTSKDYTTLLTGMDLTVTNHSNTTTWKWGLDMSQQPSGAIMRITNSPIGSYYIVGARSGADRIRLDIETVFDPRENNCIRIDNNGVQPVTLIAGSNVEMSTGQMVLPNGGIMILVPRYSAATPGYYPWKPVFVGNL